MPKKSIVQNGWTGGINKDYEVTDITSESRDGRNELNTLENGLCNINGQIRTVGVTTQAESLTTNTPDTSTKTALVYGSNIYRKQGVYRVGENVDWSGNTILTKPTKDNLGSNEARRNIMADGIAINAYANTQNDTNIFLGKMASTNAGDAQLADIGNFPSTAISPSDDFIRWASDTNNDEKFNETLFNSNQKLGAFEAESDWTVGFWDNGEADGSVTTSSSWGHISHDTETGTIVPAGGFSDSTDPANTASDISNTDYLRFGRNSTVDSPNKDVGVMFRVGALTTSGTTTKPDGLYGSGLDISDKDITIELQLNNTTGNGTDGAGNFWTNFNYLNITADSYQDNATVDYQDSNFSPNSKTWTISKTELEALNVDVAGGTSPSSGGTIITIPHGSAVHTGATFIDTSVRNFVVTLVGADMDGNSVSDPETVWVCRIFSIGLQEGSSLGWTKTISRFAQSRINEASNGDQVESLLQYYPNVLDTGNLKTVSLELYEPTNASYNGKVYYQPADDNGIGIGEIFKIADVSKSKGVKSVLSEFWEPWNSITITGCTITVGSTNTITNISSTTGLKVGMKITNGNIPTNAYITAINANGTEVEMSYTFGAGSAITSQSITFSGIVELDISAPPLSSTYSFESGYPNGTKTINALWDYGTTVGRQAYIANVIKTGKDLPVDLHNAASASLPTDIYPIVDTTLYSGTDTIEVRIKMTSGTAYEYSINGGGAYDTGHSIAAADTYQNLDTGTAGDAKHIKVSFPQASGYTDDDEWKITISKESDLILKTPVGKRWGFSDLNSIDLELPGTGITAIMSSADRLFVFSANDLTIINVAQDYEYLEATLPGHGVSDPKMVVKVGEGIAFVNDHGVFYFDGREVISLSDDKMESFSWTSAAAIGYQPEEKLIFVWYATDDVISYSLVQKAWVGITKTVSNPPDTQTLLYNNRPIWITGSDDFKMFIDDYTVNAFSMVTGKISCGDLSRTKKFIKAYVNIENGAEFELYYMIDSGSWSSAINLSNGESEVNIKKSGKTIQFKIESRATIDEGTIISDLSLVYREKTIR